MIQLSPQNIFHRNVVNLQCTVSKFCEIFAEIISSKDTAHAWCCCQHISSVAVCACTADNTYSIENLTNKDAKLALMQIKAVFRTCQMRRRSSHLHRPKHGGAWMGDCYNSAFLKQVYLSFFLVTVLSFGFFLPLVLLQTMHPCNTEDGTASVLLARLQTWRALIFNRVCQSVCLSVSDQHFYPSTLTDFDDTWSQGPYCDLVWLWP